MQLLSVQTGKDFSFVVISLHRSVTFVLVEDAETCLDMDNLTSSAVIVSTALRRIALLVICNESHQSVVGHGNTVPDGCKWILSPRGECFRWNSG
jgi:hypothetical protein